MLPDKAFSKSHRGSVSTPCLVSLQTSSIEKTRAAFAVLGLKTAPLTTFIPTKVEIASVLANEVLSLIFRHLTDRKSILNCSLVCAHWHDPARLELARMVQDMPLNGQGLLHAISNLSEVYCHSNPETKQAFAPAHAPDLLYNLIWTFLFIDQEFRNPRAQPKVTCRYFVRLMQREGAGYPLEYFDKRVLKNIYHDIRSQPLLPAPHMIRALNTGLGSNEDHNEGLEIEDTEVQELEHNFGTSQPLRSRQLSSGSFINLAGSIKFKSFKRVSQWWRSVRDEGETEHRRSTSQLELSSRPSGQLLSEMIATDVPVPPSVCPVRPLLLSSSIFPQGSTSMVSIRSIFGKLDSSINRSEGSVTISTIMTGGFTTIPHGWHIEGDGLDKVVRFPLATKPSTLGRKFTVLHSADLMADHEPDD
ncbi:hypothetical protein BGZ93_002413 [Podila epicladia]|nr:hypothetical protein BGZ93_002413 [Podila epicladia]